MASYTDLRCRGEINIGVPESVPESRNTISDLTLMNMNRGQKASSRIYSTTASNNQSALGTRQIPVSGDPHTSEIFSTPLPEVR